MDITGIAKSHIADISKASSRKEWKLLDFLREKITEYAREDAAQNVYMGNKFLAQRKSEVAKVAPDRSALMGKTERTLRGNFRTRADSITDNSAGLNKQLLTQSKQNK